MFVVVAAFVAFAFAAAAAAAAADPVQLSTIFWVVVAGILVVLISVPCLAVCVAFVPRHHPYSPVPCVPCQNGFVGPRSSVPLWLSGWLTWKIFPVPVPGRILTIRPTSSNHCTSSDDQDHHTRYFLPGDNVPDPPLPRFHQSDGSVVVVENSVRLDLRP